MYNKIFSLKNKMMVMVFLALLPFIAIIIYIVNSFMVYGAAYDNIVGNITKANNYNLNFKDEMDESLYRMVARDLSPAQLEKQENLRSPYVTIQELRSVIGSLKDITSDEASIGYLERINHDIDTLEARVGDISVNIKNGGMYDKNIVMLENNIYILTELTQDDIQNYIYYQTKSIEGLKSTLSRQLQDFVVATMLFTIVVVAVIIIMTSAWANGIINPVKKLVTVTGQIAEGDFSAKAPITTRDEISVLGHSVNDMSAKLEELVDTIKEDERRVRQTELRLLQEQINPHFLYNTLDTIVWLIESNRADEAEEMVMSLSSFFRLSLSQGREMVKVKDELKHIKSYLEIQQVRYKDILDYDIKADAQLNDCIIQKLTIQPIVENALYHGIKYKRARGKILVEAALVHGNIVITVTDDGVGIEEDELDKLREQINMPCAETEKGFGLANVNERIKMNFGTHYGIDITSEKGKGTKVTVTLPYILD